MKYRKLRKYKYQLLEDVRIPVDIKGTYESPYACVSDGYITVKKDYAWDGPSGPTIDTKTFMTGSLVHDALYQMMREYILPRTYRKTADKLLRKLCILNGMNKIRAWYVYRSVRLFGGKHAMSLNDELKVLEV